MGFLRHVPCRSASDDVIFNHFCLIYLFFWMWLSKMCTKQQTGRAAILNIHFKCNKDDISLKGLCFQLTECQGQGYCLDCDSSISHHTKAWPYYISSDLCNISAVWAANTNALLCFCPALEKWEELLHIWICTHSRCRSIQPVWHKSKQVLIILERHRKSHVNKLIAILSAAWWCC